MSQIIAPSAKITYLKASELGLALNCDLMTGLDKTTGEAAADDGPAINAAMAGATADNPLCLIMDGGSCVSGLKFPAGGHWSIIGLGWDTGFFVAAGTNNHCIHNGSSNVDINSPGAAPSRGANISIRDIFLNGNRGNGTNGNTTTGDPRTSPGGGVVGINIENIDGVVIEGVRCYNIPTFNIFIQNCGDWVVDRCHLENVLPTATVVEDNSDGIHVNGPSNDGRISNCYFRTGDDAIALNACEGYGGLITRIAIVNCVANQCISAGRIYTNSQAAGAGAQALVDGVTWTNYQANTSAWGFLIGDNSSTTPENDTITNVTFTNCKITAPNFATISDSVGTLTFDSCDWISPSADYCMFNGTGSALQVSVLNITNCRVVRTPAGSSIYTVLGTHSQFGSTVFDVVWKRVSINGFSVVDTEGYSGSAILGLLSLTGGSTLAVLQIDAIDASNIGLLIGTGGSAPTSVQGAGVLATGWTIADSIPVNNTLYLSSNDSGAPSIKIGGTAKRLTLA